MRSPGATILDSVRQRLVLGFAAEPTGPPNLVSSSRSVLPYLRSSHPARWRLQPSGGPLTSTPPPVLYHRSVAEFLIWLIQNCAQRGLLC